MTEYPYPVDYGMEYEHDLTFVELAMADAQEAEHVASYEAAAEERAREAWSEWRAERLEDDPSLTDDDATFEAWVEEQTDRAERAAEEQAEGPWR